MADSSIMDPRRPKNPILRALDKGISGMGEGAYRAGSQLAAGIPGLLHSGAGILGNIGEPNFLERAKGSLEKGGRTTEHVLKALEDIGPHTMYHDDAVNAADEGMAAPGKAVGAASDYLGEHLGAGAGLAAGVLGDAELNGLLGRKPVRLNAPLAERGVVPWKEMTAEQARNFAAKNGHLRASHLGKMYNGAPEWIQTPGDLKQLRTQLDAALREGAKIVIDNKGTLAKDWYPEAQKSIAGITKNPENAEKLANTTAVYSANKPVPMNVDLTLKHHVLEALKSNEDAVAAMPGDKLEAAKASAIFQGEMTNPPGPKIEPFSEAINPFNTKEANRSVNDTRMAKFFGYERFGHDTQHSFMTGEMHAALNRAIKKGVLPPAANVHAAQASVWSTIAKKSEGARGGADTAKGLGAFFHDHAANVTYEPGSPGAPGHMEGLNDEPMGVRREHAENMAWAKEGQSDPLYDALNIPQEGRTTGMGNWPSTRADKPPFEAAIRDPQTGEDFAGPMHFEAMLKMPADTIARFDKAPGSFPNGFLDPKGEFLTRAEAHDAAQALSSQDPALKRAGSYFQRGHHTDGGVAASEDFRGVKRGEVQRIEHNPLHVAHPLGPWEDENFNDLLKQVETFRATMDAQKGFGWNRVREVAKKAEGTANARKVEGTHLGDGEMRALYTRARRAGVNVVDNGGGGFTITGNDWAGTDPKAFQDALLGSKPGKRISEDLGGKPGTLESDYGEIPWGKDVRSPEGVATANLLEAISPKVGAALHTPKISELLGNKNKAEALSDMSSAGARKSGPARSIHNLRAIVAEHGVEGLRAKVGEFAADHEISFAEAAAKLGLPAALVATTLGSGDNQ